MTKKEIDADIKNFPGMLNTTGCQKFYSIRYHLVLAINAIIEECPNTLERTEAIKKILESNYWIERSLAQQCENVGEGC